MNGRLLGFLVWAVGMAVFAGHVSGNQATDTTVNEFGTRYPKGAHEVVPPEQREALGLDETSWTTEHGKLHPDVYKLLEKAEETLESARRTRDPFLDPVGRAGTVYVQVHLKHGQKVQADSAENKAAIKQLQSKVLSQLTAAEFYVEYPFQTLPGILGYVNRPGLKKLKTNGDVIAVCLDDKPFPRRLPKVFKVDLPPLKAGEPATQPPQGRFWGRGGKVEVEVYQALGLHERVFVMVSMRSAWQQGPEERAGEGGEIVDRVLTALTAHDFWLSSRTRSWSLNRPRLSGWVNVDGLKKLDNHPEVRRVRMEHARYPVPKDMKKRP